MDDEQFTLKDDIEEMIDYIPGTDFPRPRNREDFESEEAYEHYLAEYYFMLFPDEEFSSSSSSYRFKDNDITQDEYIPGTDIPKPRSREDFESEETYQNYLSRYYYEFFPDGEIPLSLSSYRLKGDEIIQDNLNRRK